MEVSARGDGAAADDGAHTSGGAERNAAVARG
jgi:hypothetical protein